MIDFILGLLEKLATDPRSQLIIVAGVICWLISREKPSRHARGGTLLLVIALSLFAIWKYAPSFEPIEMAVLEDMSADELRAYIASMKEATDVLWRVMEMYVAGIHFTLVLVLSWVLVLHYFPPHRRDLVAQMVVAIWWLAELQSLATGNIWCRFVLETKGSWLVENLMLTGKIPGSCSAHFGDWADWIRLLILAVVPFLFVYWVFKQAKGRAV